MFRKTGAWWFGAVLAITLMRWDYAHAVEQPRVLMLRGWFGVFSTGLDGLSDELKSKGINAVVAGHLYWTTALAEIENPSSFCGLWSWRFSVTMIRSHHLKLLETLPIKRS